MLNFVCVNAGNYLGKGKEYVEILHDMVKRNLAEGTEGRFICFTDDTELYREGIEKRLLHGGLKGWYNKLYLFKDGLFDDGDRIVFFDLDTVIVSGLDDIVKYDGKFAILEDFYRPGGMQSSVMLWEANKLNVIWETFEQAGFPNVDGGDQSWIELTGLYVDKLQDLFPKCFVSYKVSAKNNIPKDAKIVVFHGNPRPHHVTGWVEKIWKIGGGSSIELEMLPNVDESQLESNVRYSITLGLKTLDRLDHVLDKDAILVGGGPSLQNHAFYISEMQKAGHKVFALNGAYKWLKERGILADYHVIADARPENVEFIDTEYPCTYLIASHCDKSLFDVLNGKDVILWHRGHEGMEAIVNPNKDKFVAYISGGSTVGMISLSLAYALGYRKLHLFGFDSSYLEGEGHAYPQALNDNDRILDVDVFGRVFKSAPWMVAQVNEYAELAPVLVELGCEIAVYGDGLLQHMNKQMVEAAVPETEIVEKEGVWWPLNDFECKESVDHFIDDSDWIMSFCKKFDVVIQAGGNVGMWPKRMAKHFKTVYTFEPDNINFQCLVRNCPESNIIKIQGGLGDKHDLIKLQTLRHNCGAHFVDGKGSIPVFKIDDLKLENCDLIQLDIEGFEFFALCGGYVTITNHRPVVVVEMKGLGEKYGSSDDDIINLMARIGYKIGGRKNRDVVFINNGEN